MWCQKRKLGEVHGKDYAVQCTGFTLFTTFTFDPEYLEALLDSKATSKNQ